MNDWALDMYMRECKCECACMNVIKLRCGLLLLCLLALDGGQLQSMLVVINRDVVVVVRNDIWYDFISSSLDFFRNYYIYLDS